jgi:hypothetical protein
MAETEKTSPKQKPPKAKRPKAVDDGSGSRSMAARVERSLKDVDRLLAKAPNTPAADRAMAQLEQAKVSALLQLAEAIREVRRNGGQPPA